MPLPAAPKLVLWNSDGKQLMELSGYRSTPRGIALRMAITLSAADGLANHAIARNSGTSLPKVRLWRERFQEGGIGSLLEDRARSGRPKQISAQKEAAVVRTTIDAQPRDATDWSVRAMAGSQKVSPASCSGPGRSTSFKKIPGGRRGRRVTGWWIGGNHRWDRVASRKTLITHSASSKSNTTVTIGPRGQAMMGASVLSNRHTPTTNEIITAIPATDSIHIFMD